MVLAVIDRINNQLGNSGKRALIVEGDDDKHALSCFLNTVSTDWESQWRIEPAGSKANVLKIIDKQTSWIGVVDRDEWQASTVSEQQARYANLWVLPRFCIENYLIDPDVLWQAIPAAARANVAIDAVDFSTEIEKYIDLAVKHGVLWHIVNPLWKGIRAKGFVNELLNAKYEDIDSSEYLSKKLHEWHCFLSPKGIIADYEQQLKALSAQNITYKYQRVVHGKKFFERVIHPVYKKYFGQCRMTTLQTQLFKQLPQKEFDDLLPLAKLMGL